VAIARLRRWQSSSEQSLAVLRRVLDVPDHAELTRRLNLGMHRLTHEQHGAILDALKDAS
jgi:hypothetical protein